MDRVGVLGLGRMGLPVALRLLRAGVPAVGLDLDDSRMQIWREAGGETASDAAALASRVDVLVTVLPGPRELREALLGEGGALGALAPGSCWLDLTSNDPRVATEVAEEASRSGVSSLGAPLLGGPRDAEAGTLGFYLGGDPEAVDRLLPALRILGDPARFEFLGPDVAAGYTAKLLANTLWFGQAIAVTETLLLGQQLGLDLTSLRSTLAAGPGGSAFLSGHLDRLLAGDYMTDFGIDRVVEELDTVTDLAAASGTPSPLTRLVADLHREALDRFGPVGGELLAARLLETRAGRTLRA